MKPSVTSSWAITSSTFRLVHEHLGQLAELALPPLAVLAVGDDVDVPAGELRSQADVLAAAADRDVLLLVRDDDLDPLGVGVEHDLADLGRRQRVDDEGGGVGRPGDDVDLLAAQLLHHRLDAAAAHADAGADRIDAAVLGDHRDLGAAARIAGARP